MPPKPLSFETLLGGSAIRFLGSVYATARRVSVSVRLRRLLPDRRRHHLLPGGGNTFFFYGMTRDVAGTSESRMGGYDCFIIFLFYVLHVSAVHQFASYLISVHARNMLMSVHARNMLCICVSFLQFCCTVYSFMLVADMRCISCHLFLSVIHESSSHAFDLYKFHMIYDLACIFTMDIIDIMITMINNCLYVIIMLLIYGIKMTWKLPIILTILTAGTRQRRTWANTVTRGSLCRVPCFCREPGTRQRSPLLRAFFAECNSLPSAALGK